MNKNKLKEALKKIAETAEEKKNNIMDGLICGKISIQDGYSCQHQLLGDLINDISGVVEIVERGNCWIVHKDNKTVTIKKNVEVKVKEKHGKE